MIVIFVPFFWAVVILGLMAFITYKVITIKYSVPQPKKELKADEQETCKKYLVEIRLEAEKKVETERKRQHEEYQT